MPRKKPADFDKFDVAGLSEVTRLEIEEMNGKDGKKLYLTLNGKVVQYLPPVDNDFELYVKQKESGNHAVELVVLRMFQEPQVGVPKIDVEVTPEMAAYTEDKVIDWNSYGALKGRFVVVGLL